MKNILTTLTLSVLAITAFSQTTVPAPALKYSISGSYKDPIKKTELSRVLTLADFRSGYPAGWIKSYKYVDVSVTKNGKLTEKFRSKNDTLTAKQKNLLNTVSFGDNVSVNSQYSYKNTVTENIEDSHMLFHFTVVPEVQAENIGGYEQLEAYLKENKFDKIQESDSTGLRAVIMLFIVNEEGVASNPKITRTSGDTKIDKLLLNSIYKMPKYKPAQDANGTKVKQGFVFQFNFVKGGC